MCFFTGEYFDDHRLEDLSSELVEAAEKKLKVSLPPAYIELLKEQNGGELKLKKFVSNVFEGGFIKIDYLNGIGQKGGEGILIDSYIRREWGLSNKFVYLHGDSHNWIALDYRRYLGDNPPVVYLDTDTKEKIRIAEDFSDFISKLTILEGNNQSGDIHHYYEEFTREGVEEALVSGQNIYRMTAGLHYYGMNDENLNWFFTQMLESINRMMQTRPFDGISTIDYYLGLIIKIIRKRKENLMNYPQIEVLLELLTNFPANLDYNHMIRNKSNKIHRYLLLEQEKQS